MSNFSEIKTAMKKQPSSTLADHPSKAATVQHLRQVSNLLDNAIRLPGTSYGIGIDPILGLIPGGGDLAGGVLSTYIMWRAFKLGIPREMLLRMASNIALETVAGTVPVVGDLFDVAWKANVKNVEILEAHLDTPVVGQKADRWFVILLIGILVIFILIISLIGIAILTFIFALIKTLLQI